MFIETKGEKKPLLAALEANLGEEIVFHYNCRDCDDEQVTDWTEVEQEQIDSFVKDNLLFVTYDCTNCAHTEKFLHVEYIQGIENNK